MNSIGVSTMWVALLRHGGFSSSTTLPSRLIASRSFEIAGRVT